MKNRWIIAAASLAVAAVTVVGYRWWAKPEPNAQIEMLGQLPPNPNAVVYVDLAALRQSPFLAALLKWAPQSQIDADYARFVQSTGFDYERDLRRIGLGLYNSGPETTLFAVAEGRFDKRKLTAYALQAGTRVTQGGREIFSVPVSGARQISFRFLRNDRIALTNGYMGSSESVQPSLNSEAQDWRERFLRLAGSPIFAVVRESAASSGVLSEQAPRALASPELSALLNQLQWITIAGKPDAQNLRVVLEGEGSPQTNTLQMSDVLNGLLVFAEAGLHDPKTRAQLQPQTREAYLEVLKSADVSRIDRGETKSVRLVFDITPNFLEAFRPPGPGEAAPLLQQPSPKKGSIRN